MAATGLKEERAIPTPGQRLKEKPLRQEVVSRRYDLDWIRILIILTLVPYHTALIYLEDEPFYIKNTRLSMAFGQQPPAKAGRLVPRFTPDTIG